MMVLLVSAAAGQSIRVMTYNVLNYPFSLGPERHADLRQVIAAADPDILIVQEMTTSAAALTFLDSVMNAGSVQYQVGCFYPNQNLNNSVYFKTAVFQFIKNQPVPTGERDANDFVLCHISAGDTLHLISVHLKAGSDPPDIETRSRQADSIRSYTDQLPPESEIIIAGDFNIYTSSEPAFQKLLQNSGQGSGFVIDPLQLDGNWHSNPAFAAYHTQSTRLRDFGGGATGGLDDRFDVMLFSPALWDTAGILYQANSYTTFGNDGLHFNDSINELPNQAVGAEMANSLHYASDHLPVYADFTLGAPVFSSGKLLLTEFVVSPTLAEFIEIYNPGDSLIRLDNFYLTDATYAPGNTFYYNIVTGSNYGGGAFADFHARFPAGAVIAPGEYQTIALAGDSAFHAFYGIEPTYELHEDGAAAFPDVPDMREAAPGSVNGQGGLTNSDEVIVLYYWDGYSDLVRDADYVIYDDAGMVPEEAVDKTGVLIDGPDPDAGQSAYLPDTPVIQQRPAPVSGYGLSTQRIDFSEGAQPPTGGNGISGADETGENLDQTFAADLPPTPNRPYDSGQYDLYGTALLADSLGNAAGTVAILISARRGVLQQDTTDQNGFYSFTALDSGEYYLYLQRTGYLPADTSFYLSENMALQTSLLPIPPRSATVAFRSGWNLTGLPLAVENGNITAVYPNSVNGSLFKFDGSYQPSDTLRAGEGYWLRYSAFATETVTGWPLAAEVIHLQPEWNLVSGIFCPLPVSRIYDPASLLTAGNVYGFNGVYFSADTLFPGEGYWIRSSGEGAAALLCSPPPATAFTLLQKTVVPENTYTFHLSDAAGKRQQLFISEEKVDPENFRLPPLPPAGAFDARFSGDYRLSCENEAMILLQSDHYPVRIALEALPESESVQTFH
ncbi:MAG: endonuclease/exonuclease/phosphatase family protein, partial [Calditrichia bacterium]